MEDRERIVVGVDGSDQSREALRFALRDAARRGAEVKVVGVFVRPEHWPRAHWCSAPPALGEIAARIRAGAWRMVDDLVAEGGDALKQVPVQVHARAGSPARALVAEARGADLLVVGCRGRGGFSRALLGSVSTQVVLHAACPVTVVRPVAGRTDGG